VTTKKIGDEAERAAAIHLEGLGYEIIDRNWKTKWCEIDIIAQKDKVIYFVEVKYRRTDGQGGGIAAITPKKLDRMKFATRLWMQRYGQNDARLSVIEVSGARFTVTQFLEQVD
jgi:uncharacterized protein (TIGR00252 family)